jgi:hypothetical protein
VQGSNKNQVIREVVDGQQRVSSILQYINDDYPLSKNIESNCVGKKFSQLSSNEADTIRHFSFICEVFYGVDDRDILQIFSRLNTYSVALNAQELRNGKFFGPFKQSVYKLALDHLEFWRTRKIFTESTIARMNEVELTSELMILLMGGLQDKKKSIDDYYAEFEEAFPKRQQVEKQFRAVLDEINKALGEDLRDTEFRRPPLFYSLFGAVAHRMYGIPNVKLATPKKVGLSKTEASSLYDTVVSLSAILNAAKEQQQVPKKYEKFVSACLRQTDNLRPRSTRLDTIYNSIFK